MTGPLAGIRVLDLSRLLPGGFCSLLLADYGADVLKVEDTGLGDYIRWAPPTIAGVEPSAGLGAVPRAQPRQALDQARPEAERTAARCCSRLVREHDVLLESFRPGVLDRLGVGYERLREENPGLVYCAITGYGQDGPDRDRPGHDINYLARNGLLGLTRRARRAAGRGGRADRRPRRRRADGRVRRSSPRCTSASAPARASSSTSSMTRGAPELAGDGRRALLRRRRRAAARRARAGRRAAPATGTYACADGWVALGALEPKFWQALCDGLGRDDLLERQIDPAVAAELEAVFAARTRAEWAAFDDAHGCCLEPVLDLDEALARRARGGRRGRRSRARRRPCGCSARRSASRARRATARRPGPALGADTDAVLRALGYAPDEIDRLQGAGRRRRAAGRPGRELPGMSRPGLKMSELAERLRRLGRHDQALPARGPAGRRGRDRAHVAQHGLVPAGVRRRGSA